MKSLVIVIEGKTCVGKTTLAKYLNRVVGFGRLPTCTTRKPRKGEREGIDYYFKSKEEFLKLIETDALVEHTQRISEGKLEYYGLMKEVLNQPGINVVVLDVQGVKVVKGMMKENSLVINLVASEGLRRNRFIKGRKSLPKDWKEREEMDEKNSKLMEELADVELSVDRKSLKILSNEVLGRIRNLNNISLKPNTNRYN